MKFFTLLATIFLVSMSFMAFPQKVNEGFIKGKNDTIVVALTEVDNELIPWLPLPEVIVRSTRIFKTPEEKAKYSRLRYNVLKVMPYAKFARNRYTKLQTDLLAANNRREKKKLEKAFEKEIKDMFNTQIKNLTITQGGILIKLIDRETGQSSFEIVKDMRGGFNAFFYQSLARVVGHNLKEKYDLEQDRDIEKIIQSYSYYMNN